MFQSYIRILKFLIIAYSTAMSAIKCVYTLWTSKELHAYYTINIFLV